MTSVSRTISEERFLCSICLEVFSAPVTTPCGHSFCRACINQHWDNSDGIKCPVCEVDFRSRPQMKVNIVLAEMIFEFKSNKQVVDIEEHMSSDSKSAPKEEACDVSAPAGEVLCDVCPEPRLKALMSCLVCLASYCQNHLQPHLTNPRLRRHHQLIEAVPNLEERVCPEHDRPLELFCKDHSHFICLDCTSAGHKDHKAVPLKEECEVQLTTVKEQIKQRLKKIEEIRSSVDLSQKNADTEIQEGIRAFNTLMECVQQGLDSFKQSIEDKHSKIQEEAAHLLKKIETEVSVLEQREAEMEELWRSGDHLQFVQSFTSAKPAPQLNDWTKETARAPTFEGRVTKALIELERDLTLSMEVIFESEFCGVLNFEAEVTLDPDTANSHLVLSKDLTQVSFSDRQQNLPDNPERFATWYSVLGKQKISSGKFYFEVQVKGKTYWELGVARESVGRKDNNSQDVENGYWLIYYSGDGMYETKEEESFTCPKRCSPVKVGCLLIMMRAWSLSLTHLKKASSTLSQSVVSLRASCHCSIHVTIRKVQMLLLWHWFVFSANDVLFIGV
uniref:Uncharacterized protein n=1 Tax=Neogobius melanostomus TaxID=47308 RepID=A0A8C6WJK0_9GOBI